MSNKRKTAAAIQADSPIKFVQLTKGQELSAAGDIFEMGLSQALGTAKKEGTSDFSSSKLSKVRVNLVFCIFITKTYISNVFRLPN